MKRFISILLALMMLVVLFGCENTIEEKTTTTSSETSTTTNNATTDNEPSSDSTTTTTKQPTTSSTQGSGFSSATQPDFHDPVNPSVFDDAVFVGDSVTHGLQLYVMRQNNIGKYPLGQAKFLYATSLGYTNALWAVDRPGNVHPTYNGIKVRVPDGVKQTGAKKVFIMLGMNDFMTYGSDGTVKNAVTLINQILDKSPDVTIYVQSVTPILKASEGGSKTNANVRAVNQKLKAMCDTYGWIYLDVSSVLVDGDGALKSSYCSDPGSMGLHINDNACVQWIEYLRSNVYAPNMTQPTTTTTTEATTAITEATTAEVITTTVIEE